MSLSAAALRRMAEMGLSIEQVIELAEMMEASQTQRSSGAERQKRYRAKKAERYAGDVTRDVTDDVTCPLEKKVSPDPFKETQPIPPSPPKGGSSPAETDPKSVQAAFDAWNETAKRCGLPEAKSLSDPRRRAIRARLSEAGLLGWREALAAVERSKVCRGQGDRSWRADLDFVCQPKSFNRLREGFYGADARSPTGAPPSATPFAGPADLRDAIIAAHPKREEFALGYLDRCAWRDVPEKALVTTNSFIADTLRREVGPILGRFGVRVIQEHAA